MSPSKQNFKNKKMLTGTDATTLPKKKLFRLELDHRFGFTPFDGRMVKIILKPKIFAKRNK
jgi:hypothetical protein